MEFATHTHALKKYPYDKNHSEAVYLMELKSSRTTNETKYYCHEKRRRKNSIKKRVRKYIMHLISSSCNISITSHAH